MTKTFTPAQPYSEEPRPAIQLMPVVSNQVAAIGYDEATQTLAVMFTRGQGAIHHYTNVSKETCEAFVTAESIGKYFGEHIKNLPFTKYPAEPAPESEDGPQSDVAAATGSLAQTAVEA
ncbi:MAG: KTSC domain-containing protein [Rhodoferax sp.]|uniref:KTSC domain-containing protein n=1 Tax=Rhodoferax sp. TaxID=50421 RepID=UPI002ACE9F2B|nr:KTSC domain-containing protein [Rhodoferax sp.]MDZ7892370.1 KTSC domain-containing protein [Rhodoferax sp.]